MSIIEIPVQEIDFHHTSFLDKRGRLFWWKGGLYRGIAKEHAAFCKKLFEEGIVQRLIEEEFLVETELTNLTLSGYPIVLKHRCLPFVSYANEWCPQMLKDAGLLNADLMIELAAVDLRLTDAATWNILFDGCRPMLVDFGSIVSADYEGDKNWEIYSNDFYSYFIYPLRLMAQGYGNLARWLLADCEYESIQREFADLMGHRHANFPARPPSRSLVSIAHSMPYAVRNVAGKWFRLIKSARSRLASIGNLRGLDLVRQLRQELESISLPSTRTWRAGSDQDCYLPFTTSDQWTRKHRSVHKVLSDFRPPTVLDIGSNQAWYSLLAASLGSRVVVLNVDDRGVDHCYREARKKNLPILPLVMDIRHPSPGRGMGNKELAPALQRLPCDMVLALSSVHLLVFNHGHTFDQIGETFASLSKRWLLVEFIPPEDREVSERMLDRWSWYTLDNFVDALTKWFRRVSIMSSHPEPRLLLLFEK